MNAPPPAPPITIRRRWIMISAATRDGVPVQLRPATVARINNAIARFGL